MVYGLGLIYGLIVLFDKANDLWYDYFWTKPMIFLCDEANDLWFDEANWIIHVMLKHLFSKFRWQGK